MADLLDDALHPLVVVDRRTDGDACGVDILGAVARRRATVCGQRLGTAGGDGFLAVREHFGDGGSAVVGTVPLRRDVVYRESVTASASLSGVAHRADGLGQRLRILVGGVH